VEGCRAESHQGSLLTKTQEKSGAGKGVWGDIQGGRKTFQESCGKTCKRYTFCRRGGCLFKSGTRKRERRVTKDIIPSKEGSHGAAKAGGKLRCKKP